MIDTTRDALAHLIASFVWPLPLVVWPVPFALPFWAIYAWSRHGERKVRFRGQSANNDDRWSWAAIDYGSKIAKAAALLAALLTPPWVEGTGRIWLFCAGLLLMVSGVLLRRHCFKTLGDFFTFQVTVPQEHAVIRHGIYRWVRHPSYTGGMMFNVGIGLALTNFLSVLFLALGMAAAYIYRVHIEEHALVKVHGVAYSDYMLQTKRFIPFIF
jgi:protein-S-isoprenylcysteine O-methyltransferase Ste14